VGSSNNLIVIFFIRNSLR